MSRFSLVIMALIGLLVAEVNAQPQVPGGMNRPTVSPYLNLLGGFNNPAMNYFGLVRPQIQYQQQANQLQQQLQQANTQFNNLSDQQQMQQQMMLMPFTGSTIPVFNNTGGYFNRIPVGGGLGGGGGMGGMVTGGAASFGRVGGMGGMGSSGLGGGSNQPSFSRPAGGSTSGSRSPVGGLGGLGGVGGGIRR